MIIFKGMNWSNWFSYGADNSVDFEESPVTQLLGTNGVGKSSIPLIVQEVLYGKNVKKIIKANLLNRNIDAKGITASLSFSVGEDDYIVDYNRTGAKLVVVFLENGNDISSHTAPATMKSIENVLGIDFETFSQLVYQSSKASLQFLTATDTQRKKFLISLFNLERYMQVHDLFKKSLVEVNKELANIQGRYDVYEQWIKTHSFIEDPMVLVEIPNDSSSQQNALTMFKADKLNLDRQNSEINKNNSYKSELNSIDTNTLSQALHNPQGISELRKEKIGLEILSKEKLKFVRKMEGKSDTCPTCRQRIDISDSKKLAETYRNEIDISNSKVDDIIIKLKKLENLEHEDKKVLKTITQFENLTNLIDTKLPEVCVDEKELEAKINNLSAAIRAIDADVSSALSKNQKVNIHNSKIESQREQLIDYKSKLNDELNKLEVLFEKISHIEILKEAFGTNGLVSYKLEYLTKDLETVINEYLAELSRGRFQLNFILKGDKLNAEVTDNGIVVTINELSEGELARVNISTLLAIRKLMQNLSNTKLNLLFLDEVLGVLDLEGKEDLVNLLLREEAINTFLIDHSYKHPLVPTIQIVKEDTMSRLEHE